MGECIKLWVDVASIVGNAATALGIIIAIRQVPRELRAWKEQSRATRKAESAGEALVCSIRLLRELGSLRIPHDLRGGSDDAGLSETEKRKRTGRSLQKRKGREWREFLGSSDLFVNAQERALAYLADDVRLLLERIWVKKVEIFVAQKHCIGSMLQGAAADPKSWERGFGPEVDRDLAALQQEAIALLRPIAQHGDGENLAVWKRAPRQS